MDRNLIGLGERGPRISRSLTCHKVPSTKLADLVEEKLFSPFRIFGSMNIRKPLLILFACLMTGPVFAQQDTVSADTSATEGGYQDRIIKMNGLELKGKVLQVGMGEVVYEHKVDGSLQKSSVPMAEVYAVDRAGKEEEILYEQDSARGNTLDRTQMRYFIRGERDAMQGYSTPWTTVGGLAIGAAGGYFLDFSVFTLTVPLVYTLGASIPKIRVDKETVSDPAYLDREFYLKGYEREARGDRLLNALKGSAGGVLLGLGIYAILNPDQLR